MLTLSDEHYEVRCVHRPVSADGGQFITFLFTARHVLNILNERWGIFTCAQKLAYSHLNLRHGTKQKRVMKKLKIKIELLRRNGPVIKPWSQS